MRLKWAMAAGVVVGAAAALGFAWPWSGSAKVLRLPGTVEVHEVRLGPRVAGRVKRVYAAEGDHARAGQTLVELEVADLAARRDAMAARVAQVKAEHERAVNGPRPREKDAARAALDAARARLVKMEKGFRDEETRQAESDLEAAQSDTQRALDDYNRTTRLARGAASPEQLETARTTLERARARAAAAKARLDMHKAGSRPEDVNEAKAEVQKAAAALDLLEEGTRAEDKALAAARLKEAEAALAEAEVNLHEATVKASEDCVVEIVGVRAGDLVSAHQPVVRVLRTGDLWVKTYVPETELGKVRLGMAVKVTMDSYPEKPFDGRVVHIGAESEFTPRNVQTLDERRQQLFGVRVKIDDPRGLFKSGMAAEVFIPVISDQ